jgi:hypothetical protein
MNNLKPLPNSQRQLEKQAIQPNTLPAEFGSPSINRGNETAFDNTDQKPFTVGLEDIDTAIDYYYKNIIKPTVIQNSQLIDVPIYYGSPERWNSIQNNGYLRDKNSKLMVPLIIYKRTSVSKNRSIANKLDANKVNNLYVYQKKYDNRNYYDNFSTSNGLENRKPIDKIYVTAIPDYVTIDYSCIIFTDYVHQMNKIVEAINYASDSYWGEPERFKFQAFIDSFDTTTELQTGEDRIVKTTFTLKLNGYILPDAMIKDMSYNPILYSKGRVTFGIETTSNLNN